MSRFRFTRPHLLFQILLLINFASGCHAPRELEIHPELTASPREGVTVTNRDNFTYPRVTVFVKGHFTAEAGDIIPGQSVQIPFDSFVDDGGHRFNVTTMKPEAIRVRAWFGDQAASKIFQVK
ncbi:MAG TPA: hypothetical protein VGC91_21180 [Pyrinomonadaceae bacterium]|jgi:hypothetical protein